MRYLSIFLLLLISCSDPSRFKIDLEYINTIMPSDIYNVEGDYAMKRNQFIYHINASKTSIFVYNRNYTPIDTLFRKGQGPGEIKGKISQLLVKNDTVFAYDRTSNEVHVYEDDKITSYKIECEEDISSMYLYKNDFLMLTYKFIDDKTIQWSGILFDNRFNKKEKIFAYLDPFDTKRFNPKIIVANENIIYVGNQNNFNTVDIDCYVDEKFAYKIKRNFIKRIPSKELKESWNKLADLQPPKQKKLALMVLENSYQKPYENLVISNRYLWLMKQPIPEFEFEANFIVYKDSTNYTTYTYQYSDSTLFHNFEICSDTLKVKKYDCNRLISIDNFKINFF
ncbi:MAG: hypothetical protein JXR48_03025 [Candidatus Delongbacteria bacterium]|nr:hypothetical protein [Candidatus Delongbacteria bacterium]MBN2833921.1 hypothetical protein [Candidatus Delongbacteria bacterium]